MATTPEGIEYPVGSDPFDPAGDLAAQAASFESHVIVPVPSVSARGALATTVAPTAANPLFVHRQDAAAGRELEWTPDGTAWRTIASRIDVQGASATSQRATFIKSGHVAVTTNGNGDASITLAEAFPNAMLVVLLSDGTPTAQLGAVLLKWTAGSSNPSTITFRAYQTSGAVLASQSVTLAFVAIGW